VSDPLWYKDAVFYELDVKAFQDSNGDGIGDLQGRHPAPGVTPKNRKRIEGDDADQPKEPFTLS
jgi:hypothetical protein